MPNAWTTQSDMHGITDVKLNVVLNDDPETRLGRSAKLPGMLSVELLKVACITVLRKTLPIKLFNLINYNPQTKNLTRYQNVCDKNK